MHRIAFALLSAAAVTTAVWGCSKGGPSEGTEGGPCYGNNTCNADLICLSDLCVDPTWSGPDAATSISGDGGTLPDSSDGGAVHHGGDAGTKVMLVLDKSGSMKTLASSDTQWGCANDGAGNGYNPNGDCKWNTLKSLLSGANGFLDQTAGSVRHGMVIFSDPNSGDSCSPGVVEVAVASTAGANVAQIKQKLATYVPVGGTPSSATLRDLVNEPSLLSAEPTNNYVLLVTDGLPNCNSSLSTCTACTNAGDPSKMCGDVRNCLDDVALVSAVKALKAKGIDTFVVGFGSAFDNVDARRVLDAAAEAGGQALAGQATKFYAATNAAELQSVLDQIKGKL
ncbi:MAG TPA: hypothetical protein VGK67_02120 [Myxococcales bacterium]|jgi:hypothetical protein